MKVDRVTYQKIFPTGMMYLNHKIGVEIQVDENDDWQEAFDLAKRMVEKWNLESNPSMAAAMEYSQLDIPVIPKTNEEKRQETIRGWIATISSMATKSGLENLRPLIEKTKIPELTEAFENKIKEFQ